MFFCNVTVPTEYYTYLHTLALHDALPILSVFHLWKAMDWDDLRHFTSVARHGGLSGAARHLGVSAQTVGRRIAALEADIGTPLRSEEHTSELQSLMRNSYAVFCLKKKTTYLPKIHTSMKQNLATTY